MAMRSEVPPVPARIARAVARAATANRLTPKQTKFTAYVAAGGTQTAAYRAAYESKCANPSAAIVAASRLAGQTNIKATLEQARGTAALLSSEKGAVTRDKISTYLEAALDDLAESRDYATLAKVAKVAGEQVHVQAFAKRREADDVAQLTDFISEMRSLRTELVQQGVAKADIDIVALPAAADAPTQNQQLTHSVEIADKQAAECEPGDGLE